MKRYNRTRLSVWLTSMALMISLCVVSFAGNNSQLLTSNNGNITAKQSTKPAVEITALSKYARDLTRLAKQGRLTISAGHAEEINYAINVLSRRDRSNPILVGEPGNGQATIIKGVAQRI